MAETAPERIYLWNHPKWAAIEHEELPYSAWPVTDPNGGGVEYVRADLAFRAAPREPGEAENRIARMQTALKLAATEFGRLWVAFDRGDSRRVRASELEQAMLDALAARPDAGDGTGETGATPGGPHDR